MTVAGSAEVDKYPEVQAVAYAQWFTYAFALWEEQFQAGSQATSINTQTRRSARATF